MRRASASLTSGSGGIGHDPRRAGPSARPRQPSPPRAAWPDTPPRSPTRTDRPSHRGPRGRGCNRSDPAARGRRSCALVPAHGLRLTKTMRQTSEHLAGRASEASPAAGGRRRLRPRIRQRQRAAGGAGRRAGGHGLQDEGRRRRLTRGEAHIVRDGTPARALWRHRRNRSGVAPTYVLLVVK